MIIFLYGQDTYRLKEKTREIIDHYRKTQKSGLNLKYFDSENLEFGDFLAGLRSVSMFGEKKLLVLKNIASNKGFQEDFLKEIKKLAASEDVILFSQEGEAPERAFFNSLKKNAKCQEFRLLKGQQLRNWVGKKLGKQSIDKKALDRLIEMVGNNLWQMSNEIKKLSDYRSGRTIQLKDIELLVKPKIEADIFKTIDAIAAKNKKEALSLIHKHLERGDSHLYLLAMISFQFRNLLTVKSGARLKSHPYVIQKTMRQARHFSLDELKKIYRRIFQADLDIKTGKIDPDTALDLFIARI